MRLEAVCSVLALCEESVPLPPTVNDAEATHRTIKHHLPNDQSGLACHGGARARLSTVTQQSGAKRARLSLDVNVYPKVLERFETMHADVLIPSAHAAACLQNSNGRAPRI